MILNFHHLFFLKKEKRDPKRLSSIYLRITISGKRAEISTGRQVGEDQWLSRGGRVNGSSCEVKKLNTHLVFLEHQLYEAYYLMVFQKEKITATTLKSRLLGIDDPPKTLVPIFQRHNNRIASLVPRDYSAGTLERYKTSLAHTIAFMQGKYHISDINIQDIDPEFITEYDFFLRSVRNCSNNTTVKYLKNFKKIIGICLANGWMDKDPFVMYKARIKEVAAVYLLEDELGAITKKNFEVNRLNQVKDIFLFCCYTGLAYSDVSKIGLGNIVTGVDGKKWLFFNRTKTAIASHVPLLPYALEIIDRYKEHVCRKVQQKLLPVLSNQKMNSYLKEIADNCGLQKELTFHAARHTFATTITLNNHVPLESVSKMLGHKSIITTEHYAKSKDEKVSLDMEPLYLKFQNRVE